MSNTIIAKNEIPTVSEALKRAIAARRLSKSEVARIGRLSPAVIGRFVNGERTLNGESIDSLAAGLGMELVDAELLEKAIAFVLNLMPDDKCEVAEEAFRMLRLCLKATSVTANPNLTAPGLAPNIEVVEVRVKREDLEAVPPKKGRPKRSV